MPDSSRAKSIYRDDYTTTADVVMETKKERVYGIDLFRFFAAFLVVGVHVFRVSVDMDPANGSDAAYFISSFFYAVLFCAVNCFGIISGYVGYNDNGTYPKVSNLLVFWGQAVFYRFLGYIISSTKGLSSFSHFMLCFFPVTKGNNWYLIAFFEMMLLMAPGINSIVKHSSRRMNFRMLCWVFILTSVFSLTKGFLFSNPFALNDGYSAIWLGILFFYGASIRKFGWLQRIEKRKGFLLCLSILLFMAIWRTFVPKILQVLIHVPKGRDFWYDYTSPAIVLLAVTLLISFEKMKIPVKLIPTVQRLSATTFGIFILHVTVFDSVIRPCIRPIIELPAVIQPFAALMATFFIVILCLLLDMIRDQIFKWLKLRKGADAIERLLWNFLIGIENKVCCTGGVFR